MCVMLKWIRLKKFHSDFLTVSFENQFCASINDAGILYMWMQVSVEWF